MNHYRRDTNSGDVILAPQVQRYFRVFAVVLLISTLSISVRSNVFAQGATSAATPGFSPSEEKTGARSQHSLEVASREELLKIVDKQKALIKALQARLEELEESAKPTPEKKQ